MSDQGASGETPASAVADALAKRARTRQIRDKGLVEAARGGDATAFGKLYDAWVDSVYDRAINAGASAAEAREVTEQTFLTVHRDLGKLKQPAAFGAKVLQVARRETQAKVTSDRPHHAPAGGPGTAEDRLTRATDAGTTAADHDVAIVMREAAGALDEKTREVLDLHFRQALTRNETAAVLGEQPEKVAETIAKLPPALAALTRARVLWRGGEPEDPALREELEAENIKTFGATAVRVINKFASKNDRARARSLIGIPPIELFASVPLADAPAGLKTSVATVLVTSSVPMEGSAFVKRDDKGAIIDAPKAKSASSSVRPGLDEKRPALDSKKAAQVAAAALAAERASDSAAAAADVAAAKSAALEDKPVEKLSRKDKRAADKEAAAQETAQAAKLAEEQAAATQAAKEKAAAVKAAAAKSAAEKDAAAKAAATGKVEPVEAKVDEKASDAKAEKKADPGKSDTAAKTAGAAGVGAAAGIGAAKVLDGKDDETAIATQDEKPGDGAKDRDRSKDSKDETDRDDGASDSKRGQGQSIAAGAVGAAAGVAAASALGDAAGADEPTVEIDAIDDKSTESGSTKSGSAKSGTGGGKAAAAGAVAGASTAAATKKAGPKPTGAAMGGATYVDDEDGAGSGAGKWIAIGVAAVLLLGVIIFVATRGSGDTKNVAAGSGTTTSTAGPTTTGAKVTTTAAVTTTTAAPSETTTAVPVTVPTPVTTGGGGPVITSTPTTQAVTTTTKAPTQVTVNFSLTETSVSNDFLMASPGAPKILWDVTATGPAQVLVSGWANASSNGFSDPRMTSGGPVAICPGVIQDSVNGKICRMDAAGPFNYTITVTPADNPAGKQIQQRSLNKKG